MTSNDIRPFAPKPPNMTPIAPVTPEDDRPAICDLLSEHADPIRKIKEGIESNPLYDPKLHDDLWMLRFWLTHKSGSSKTEKALQSAIDAASETLEYRKRHKLDEEDIRSKWLNWDGPDGRVEPEFWRKYCGFSEKYAVFHGQLHPDRGTVGLVKYADMRPGERIAGMSLEEEMDIYVINTEWRFQVNDEVTRRTGRLTKGVICLSFGGIGLQHLNLEAARRDSAGNKMILNVYPELDGGTFITKVPTIFQHILSVVRPFYPKRLMEKLDFVVNEKDANRVIPRFAALDTVPECFRGTYPSWPPPHNGSNVVEDHQTREGEEPI